MPTAPTPEEIAERARQVREVGFWGRGQKTTEALQWYEPWTEAERLKRLA